jgi:hypothetical protein
MAKQATWRFSLSNLFKNKIHHVRTKEENELNLKHTLFQLITEPDYVI